MQDLLTQIVQALKSNLSVDITISIRPPDELTHKPTLSIDSHNHADEHDDHDTSVSWQLLESAGVEGNDVLAYLSQRYPPERIQQCIDRIAGNAGIRSKPAYLIKALNNHYYKGRRTG